MSFFFGGGDTISTSAPKLGAMRIQTSSFGFPLTIQYGKSRLPSNLIWYGDFVATAHEQESGGKGGDTSGSYTYYTYTTGVAMALCEGPIVGIDSIWAGNKEVIPTEQTASENKTVPASPPYTVTVAHAGSFSEDVSVSYTVDLPKTGLTWFGAYIGGQAGGASSSIAYIGVGAPDAGPTGYGYPSATNPAGNNKKIVKLKRVVGVPAANQYNVVSGVYSFHANSANKAYKFTYKWASSALNELGLTLFKGEYPQTPWTHLTTKHPSEALSYEGVAYVATSAYNLGQDAHLPNHSFEVTGLLPYDDGAIDDAPPADIVKDLITNSTYGAALPESIVDDLGVYESYCMASGFFLSPTYDQQRPAHECVAELVQLTNSATVWSEGKIKIIPYCDFVVEGNNYTYYPILNPIYQVTDDDLIDIGGDPIIVTRKTQADAFNSVQVEFWNRSNQYNIEIMEAVDQSNIERFGSRPMQPIQAHSITEAGVARNIAQTILQRALYIRNVYEFHVGWNYCVLEPMDIVLLTDLALGLDNTPVRIVEIGEDEYGELTMIAEEIPDGVSNYATYSFQSGEGYQADYNVDPGNINSPVIFDNVGAAALTGFEINVAVSGGLYWGGCAVYVSTDNITFARVGTISSKSRHGTLTSNFPAGLDPDTTNTCSINLTISAGQLTGGTAQDADNRSLLAWIEGEWISFSDCTLTSEHNYDLDTYIRRGLYGTQKVAHAAGSRFVRIDQSVFKYPYDKDFIGKTIYFKFPSFNIYGGGSQSLAEVATTAYTINGPAGVPSDVLSALVTPALSGLLIEWPAVPDQDLAEYEVRKGTSWGTAAYVGRSRTTWLSVPATTIGTHTWLVKAIDTQGDYSENAASGILSVSAPSAPPITQQVIDNNILLYWTAPASTQSIKTYEIRKGGTWAGGTVIGNKSGLFTSVFETTAGTYTYWIAAIDIGGNYGEPAFVTAIVSQPPDYILRADIDSVFDGSFNNAALSSGVVTAPIDVTTSYQNHFINNSWNTPSNQVSAGYPIFIEKALTLGNYTEYIDYGANLATSKISLTVNNSVVSGAPGITTDILTSLDNSSFTTFNNVNSVFASNFRYVRARVNFTGGANGTDLMNLNSLNIKLDIKTKSDSGNVTCVNTDNSNAIVGANAGGTTVLFNETFISVESITTTAQGTTPLTAIYDFIGNTVSPVGFKVYLFNNAGARASGSVSWSAKGY